MILSCLKGRKTELKVSEESIWDKVTRNKRVAGGVVFDEERGCQQV